MTPEQFEAWAVKQKSQARRVVCLYEAGPFGYSLQQRLNALGITCHVVRPQDWDKHGQQVKTDGRDTRELARAAEKTVATQRPKGLGALTAQIIDNEVLDWSRFNNRRQVGSFTGLCPSEHSSGGSRRQDSINKHGNPRLRHALVEAVWRMMRLLRGWNRLKKVLEKLSQGEGLKAPNKKKITVALARELAVDLCRLNTGRATQASLGCIAAEQGEETEAGEEDQELVMSV